MDRFILLIATPYFPLVDGMRLVLSALYTIWRRVKPKRKIRKIEGVTRCILLKMIGTHESFQLKTTLTNDLGNIVWFRNVALRFHLILHMYSLIRECTSIYLTNCNPNKLFTHTKYEQSSTMVPYHVRKARSPDVSGLRTSYHH